MSDRAEREAFDYGTLDEQTREIVLRKTDETHGLMRDAIRLGGSCDDSPRLRGWGFWNDAGVSSHTVRSVHAQQRAMLKATAVSHGTALELGRVFTHGPSPWNLSKRDSVENVQKNCSSILLRERKSGNASFIAVGASGSFSPRCGKTVLQLPARVLYELASASDAVIEQVEAGQILRRLRRSKQRGRQSARLAWRWRHDRRPLND